MPIDPQDEYRRLGDAYMAFAGLLDSISPALYEAAPDVSGWSPAQHLFHILKANGMMLKGIEMICRGDRRVRPEGEPNRMGRIILDGERFLRGGQAPDAVVPPEVLSADDLRAALDRSRATYDASAALVPDVATARGCLPHMFLGELDARQWLRLARLHSEHHLALIHTILAARETA